MVKTHGNPIIYLTTFLGYLAYFAGHLFFALMIIPIFLVLLPFKRSRQSFLVFAFNTYVYFLTRVYLPFLRVYRFKEISGFDTTVRSIPAVYVANHRSRIDGPILLSLLKNTGVVMKIDYARNPLYSGFVKYLDFIPMDSESLDSLAGAIERSRQLIKTGKSILVFPEGTRASGNRPLPFKTLAFRVAQTMDIAVVPVVIHSELPFMAKRKHSIFPGRTFDFTVRCLDPVRSLPGEQPGDFAGRIERIIAGQLRVLDKGTVWED